MNPAGQLIGQDAINTAVAFDRIFARKNVRNRDYFKVRFRVYWHTVVMAFIDDVQMRRSQLLYQFFLYRRLHLHAQPPKFPICYRTQYTGVSADVNVINQSITC